jgi:acyl carrier protein phosphodiesterase
MQALIKKGADEYNAMKKKFEEKLAKVPEHQKKFWQDRFDLLKLTISKCKAEMKNIEAKLNDQVSKELKTPTAPVKKSRRLYRNRYRENYNKKMFGTRRLDLKEDILAKINSAKARIANAVKNFKESNSKTMNSAWEKTQDAFKKSKQSLKSYADDLIQKIQDLTRDHRPKAELQHIADELKKIEEQELNWEENHPELYKKWLERVKELQKQNAAEKNTTKRRRLNVLTNSLEKLQGYAKDFSEGFNTAMTQVKDLSRAKAEEIKALLEKKLKQARETATDLEKQHQEVVAKAEKLNNDLMDKAEKDMDACAEAFHNAKASLKDAANKKWKAAKLYYNELQEKIQKASIDRRMYKSQFVDKAKSIVSGLKDKIVKFEEGVKAAMRVTG